MINEEIKTAAKEMFAKIEAAANEAMANKYYSTAATLAIALRRLQLNYGGGIPLCQTGCEVLDQSYEKMRKLIKVPIASEDWDTVAYASEFLSKLDGVFADEY